MTVIEGQFVAAPTVTELFEGKQKPVDYTLHEGVYIADKHIENPFLVEAGFKKEHSLEVRLRGGE